MRITHFSSSKRFVILLCLVVTCALVGYYTRNRLSRTDGFDQAVSPLQKSALAEQPSSPLQPISPLNTITYTQLRIDSTSPASGTTGVDVDTVIQIAFDRPAVNITDTTDQSGLPQPLKLDPPVAGIGTWVNSNLYQFKPLILMLGATEYRVSVLPFQGIEERRLDTTQVFTFGTGVPFVVSSQPNGMFVSPRQSISVRFNQPMDSASTQAAFEVLRLSNQQPITGTFGWAESRRTLIFYPSQPYAFGEVYLINLAQNALSFSRRGLLREPYRSQFSTVPYPAVESLYPTPGQQNLNVDDQVTIRFNTWMSGTNVLEHLHIAPAISTTYVYSSYSSDNRSVTLSWSKEPATTYTVTLDAATQDQFGNSLGDTATEGAIISPTGLDRSTVFTFTTGDLPSFASFSFGWLTHLSAYTQTQTALYYRNITQTRISLYRVPLRELVRLTSWQNAGPRFEYHSPDPIENLLWSKTYSLNSQRNVIQSQAISFTDRTGKPLAPGVYFLEAGEPDASNMGYLPGRLQAVVVLSNASLLVKKGSQGQSLAWLSDLRTGEPVANRPITFLDNGFYQTTGQTDADGLAIANMQVDPSNYTAPLVAVSGEPGDDDFAIASSEWQDGIAPSDFGLPYFNYEQGYVTHFYTDRPIYRPGQRVYWKGIVRRWRNERYQLPTVETALTVRVRNSQGTIISETVATLSDLGTVDGYIDLAEETITGDYYLEAITNHGPLLADSNGVGFVVAAYRKPEFDIHVAADKAAYKQGETIQIRTQANYFSGGVLAGGQVNWRVTAAPYQFAWQPKPEEMQRVPRWYAFAPFDPKQLDLDPYGAFRSGLVQEGTGMTGEDGSFSLELPADLAESLVSQRWTLDLIVQSSTHQFVNRHVDFVVHRGDYYVGIGLGGYVLKSQEANQIDLVAIQPDGSRYAGADLDVGIYEYRWSSVYQRQADGFYRWNNSVEPQLIFSNTTTSDEMGNATQLWTPTKGGQYLITVRSKDAHDNPINSATMIWVSEGPRGSYVAWPQSNDERLELIADRKLYRPGDTAQILVTSPFSGTVKALITIERGGVLSATVRDLTSNSALIDVPIEEAYVPDVFVGVVLVHSADQNDPVPAMRMGYVQLKVDSQSKELKIAVHPSASKLRPADTITYSVAIRDSEGQPAANSEVSVALVDKAVLALYPKVEVPLLDLFYYDRGLGVSTGATLIINRDRLSQQAGTGQKGGGGGGGLGMTLRQEFPDLAWWRANYRTDAQGNLQFSLKLPDNLTTWVLMVKVIDRQTRVGETTHEIVATKDLQVRPLLPRFFTAGDEAIIGATVLNAGEQTVKNVGYSIRVSGATLDSRSNRVVATLAPNQSALFRLPILVDGNANSVIVTMTARTMLGSPSEGLGDSVQITIPILRYSTPDLFAQSGVLSGTALTLPITLTDYIGGPAELTVNLQGSLAATMLDGLSYLEHYPWECNEQTLSRFLPNLYTLRTLETLGIANDEFKRHLTFQVAVGVQRLLARQNSDGGWGYWPGNPSAVFTTAYVVWGLAQARNAGYPVPEEMIQNGLNFLGGSYISPATSKRWEINESAFSHFVLAELGRGDPGRMSVLYDNRDRLNIYGKAFLAMAMAKVETANGSFFNAIDTLATEILEAAQSTSSAVTWHEVTHDWQTMNSDVRSSAVVLEMLLRLYPDAPLLPKVVRGLMEARRSGYWGNTQETTWSLIALTDWLNVTQELAGKYEWNAAFNEHWLGNGRFDVSQRSDAAQLRNEVAAWLNTEFNSLTLTRSNDSGQLYYTSYVHYAADALSVKPQSHGVQIAQHFEPVVSPTATIKIGDLVSITLEIDAERDLHLLAIEAPLPAGLEAVDPRFDQPHMLSWPAYIDTRDEKIVLFYNQLTTGHYSITFRARATLSGNFRVLPATAQMMYADEIWGRSGGQEIVIEE